MNIEELKEKEKEFQEKINQLYDDFGKSFINTYYERFHHKDTSQFDRDYMEYLYIYGSEHHNLSGIEFRDGTIQRVGVWHDSIVKYWEEISKEKFLKGIQKYIEDFHLTEFLEVKKE